MKALISSFHCQRNVPSFQGRKLSSVIQFFPRIWLCNSLPKLYWFYGIIRRKNNEILRSKCVESLKIQYASGNFVMLECRYVLLTVERRFVHDLLCKKTLLGRKSWCRSKMYLSFNDQLNSEEVNYVSFAPPLILLLKKRAILSFHAKSNQNLTWPLRIW